MILTSLLDGRVAMQSMTLTREKGRGPCLPDLVRSPLLSSGAPLLSSAPLASSALPAPWSALSVLMGVRSDPDMELGNVYKPLVFLE